MMDLRDNSSGGVAEIAGLHGAFSFPEHLLQQLWLRGDFDARALRLRDGRSLRLRRRGRWNRLAGPDFADAEMEVGDGADRAVWSGAVEVHLRAVDWDQHGHAKDPAYDRVVLHVVLFPSMREWTAGADGRRIPILELLPLLERDLEAYAEEAAVEGIAGRPYSQLREALAAVPVERLRAEVARHAERRWTAKTRLAGARVARLGWAEACHQAALEVLGYRPNRAPMLALAEAVPLADWRAAALTGLTEWDAWIDGAMGMVVQIDWARGGVRPANQPRRRLRQYAQWIAAGPDWPERLAEQAATLVEPLVGGNVVASTGLRARRKSWRLRETRERLRSNVCGGALGGTRFDTMVCDAWLPLLAARASTPEQGEHLGRLWSVWVPGDGPEEMSRLAREFQVGGASGEALAQGDLQGLLGWLAALAPRGGRGA